MAQRNLWLDWEIETLCFCYRSMTLRDLADELPRHTPNSIRYRARKLGLTRPYYKALDPPRLDELQRLRDFNRASLQRQRLRRHADNPS